MAKKIDLQPIEKRHITELSSFLDSMGIRSEIDPDLDFVADDLETDTQWEPKGQNIRSRYFKLEGMHINGICYTIQQIWEIYGDAGLRRMTNEFQVTCELWVKRNLGGDTKHQENLKAKTKKKKKGLFKRESIDFKWVGGQIADILNQDTSLKEPLLAEMVTYQNNTKSYEDKYTDKDADIWIVPIFMPSEKELSKGAKALRATGIRKFRTSGVYGHVEDIRMIPTEQGVLIRIIPTIRSFSSLLFPFEDAFRAYDRIAKHIRDYIFPQIL